MEAVILEFIIVFVGTCMTVAISHFGLGQRSAALHLAERGSAAFLLIVLSPILLITFLALKLAREGAKAFRVTEAEEDGKTYRKITFQIAEFGPEQDAVSRVVRRLSLQELPWLANVAKGDAHLPKLTDAWRPYRTPRQQIADLCQADSPDHLRNVLIENARGRLNKLNNLDWFVVHRFHMLTSAVFVTGGDPLDEDWDEGEGWHGNMDPFDFELAQYDELIADLDGFPISPEELTRARKLYPLMKEICHSAVAEAHLRARAEHGPGAGRDRRRSDGYGRTRQAGQQRQRESCGSKPTRVRGSRRITSRSSGGGSGGDDPGGEPEPAARWRSGQHHPHLDLRHSRPGEVTQ